MHPKICISRSTQRFNKTTSNNNESEIIIFEKPLIEQINHWTWEDLWKSHHASSQIWNTTLSAGIVEYADCIFAVRGETPTTSIQIMTLYRVWWWGSSLKDLKMWSIPSLLLLPGPLWLRGSTCLGPIYGSNRTIQSFI